MSYEVALTKSLKFLSLDKTQMPKLEAKKIQPSNAAPPQLHKSKATPSSTNTKQLPLTPPRLLQLRARLQRSKQETVFKTKTLPLTPKTKVIASKSTQIIKLHTRPFRV